jgi:hypothetical protein
MIPHFVSIIVLLLFDLLYVTTDGIAGRIIECDAVKGTKLVQKGCLDMIY